jgi:hypothetical protein
MGAMEYTLPKLVRKYLFTKKVYPNRVYDINHEQVLKAQGVIIYGMAYHDCQTVEKHSL